MAELIVRPLEIADLPALYRLIPRLWIDQDIAPTNDIWIETSADFIKQNLGSTVTGAVAVDPANPDEMVSCGLGVVWQQLPSYWNTTGKCGFCQWFYTLPEYRGQKLGEQVMRLVMDWFVGQGITRVQLNATHPAMPFYERFGFELAQDWPQMQWRAPSNGSESI